MELREYVMCSALRASGLGFTAVVNHCDHSIPLYHPFFLKSAFFRVTVVTFICAQL